MRWKVPQASGKIEAPITVAPKLLFPASFQGCRAATVSRTFARKVIIILFPVKMYEY